MARSSHLVFIPHLSCNGAVFSVFSRVGQRTLQYQSDVLETVVLVNPSEETAASEVSHDRAPETERCRVMTTRCSADPALTVQPPLFCGNFGFSVRQEIYVEQVFRVSMHL